jgi:mannan endo-1,4-beta-mannosidase
MTTAHRRISDQRSFVSTTMLASAAATLALSLSACTEEVIEAPEPEVASVEQAANANGTFYISGTTLKDTDGYSFVMRGINNDMQWYYSNALTAFSGIATSGANTVRIGVNASQTAQQVRDAIQAAVNHRLIAVVELHDCYGSDNVACLNDLVDRWTSSGVYATNGKGLKQVMLDFRRYTILNIANEFMGTWNRHADWYNAYYNAIGNLRARGIPHVLMLDAAGWGQELTSLTDSTYGAAKLLQNRDPNLIFSMHLYDTAAPNATAVNNVFNSLSGIPWVVGEFGYQHGNPAQPVDEDTIMSRAQAGGVGYIAWSWKGNGNGVEYLDMSSNWDSLMPNAWGDRVINGANGFQQTAAQSAQFALGHDRVYALRPSHNSNLCLDVAGASVAAGANVQVWSCLGNMAQKFRAIDRGNGWFALQNINSGKCVEVAAWGTYDGANIIQWDCLWNPNQLWRAVNVGWGLVKLVNRHSGKVMEMAGWQSNDPGTNVQLWTWDWSGDMKWNLTLQ